MTQVTVIIDHPDRQQQIVLFNVDPRALRLHLPLHRDGVFNINGTARLVNGRFGTENGHLLPAPQPNPPEIDF